MTKKDDGNVLGLRKLTCSLGLKSITAHKWDEQGRTDADSDLFLVTDEDNFISPDHRLPDSKRKEKADYF